MLHYDQRVFVNKSSYEPRKESKGACKGHFALWLRGLFGDPYLFLPKQDQIIISREFKKIVK